MDKVLVKRYIIYSVSTILFILFVFVGNDQIALSVQTWFKSSDIVKIGNTIIKKPDNWFLSYEKGKTDSNGFLYGFFPLFSSGNRDDNIVYTFSKIGSTNNQIIFSQLTPEMVIKSRNILIKLSNRQDSVSYDILSFNGFKALSRKLNQPDNYKFSISIPSLSLYILVNSLEDLCEFKLSSQMEEVTRP